MRSSIVYTVKSLPVYNVPNYSSDTTTSGHLQYFKNKFPQADAVQLVHNARLETEASGIRITPAGNWLSTLSA